MEFNEALKKYRDDNNLTMRDISLKTNVEFRRLRVIASGGACSDVIKKQISDALGGVFEDYVTKKKCSVCGKEFIPKLKSSETCSVECSAKRNKESCKKTKKETMADRLINYRETAGITQKQLADLIGSTLVTIKTLEKGGVYSDETGKKIYDALGSRFKKFLKPTTCKCGKVFYKRRESVKYCSKKCSKKYYQKSEQCKENERIRTQEERERFKKKAKIREVKSIENFMDGKQYGERQREYLLGIQKTQRMECR